MRYVKGKGMIDSAGNVVMSKRKCDLAMARIYGCRNDITAFTRLVIESRVSSKSLRDAYAAGRATAVKKGKSNE